MPNSTDTENSPGAPTKFREEFVNQAYVACSEGGFKDLSLSRLFDVSKSTINRWKKDHPEFYSAIKKGKDEFDCENVEASALKRAKGFRYTEVHRELRTVPDLTSPYQITAVGDGESPGDVRHPTIEKMVIVKKISKYIPPETKAFEFWLCNRNPDRWRKLKHVEVTGPGGESLLGSAPVGALLAALEQFGGKEYVEMLKKSLIEYDASIKQS